MPYAQNKLIELVALQKFMELDAFASIIESMYEIDLNHTSTRHQAQLRITQMYKQVPVFAGNLRFPEKYHVNLSTGRIANSLRQLIKVMATFGSRDDGDNGSDNNFKTTCPTLDEVLKLTLEVCLKMFSKDDVDKFYSILDQLLGHIFNLGQEKLIEAGIYCRASFEEKYGFSWNN